MSQEEEVVCVAPGLGFNYEAGECGRGIVRVPVLQWMFQSEHLSERSLVLY